MTRLLPIDPRALQAVRTCLSGLTRRNTHSERADAHQVPGLTGGCTNRAELVFHSEEPGERRRCLPARSSTMRTAAKVPRARVPSKLVTRMSDDIQVYHAAIVCFFIPFEDFYSHLDWYTALYHQKTASRDWQRSPDPFSSQSVSFPDDTRSKSWRLLRKRSALGRPQTAALRAAMPACRRSPMVVQPTCRSPVARTGVK
ncbi:hypothetical protein K525DRAFT_287028 [Schizophyllum commune Loenen D]|nr:hypothetical protein K525DRAFT_287028 [Schizophyllum commune Loenen D]